MFSQLAIHNFRKYDDLVLPLEAHNEIVGPNGYGKTTVLEATHWLLAGFSPLSKELSEFAPHAWQKSPPGQWVTTVELQDENHKIRRVVQWAQVDDVLKGTSSLLLDNKATNQRNLNKYYSVVFFSPEYIDLLSTHRSKRLEWLDRVGRGFIPQYASVLNNYIHVLRERNRLLHTIRKERFTNPGYEPNTLLLETLTKQLVELGTSLIQLRQQSVGHINDQWSGQPYELQYLVVKPLEFSPEVLQKELYVGRTLRGPHLDDWSIKDNRHEHLSVLQWGSRGQRKLALLSLMVTLVHTYQAVRDLNPLILLDDPANELDVTNSKLFRSMINEAAFQIVETHIKS